MPSGELIKLPRDIHVSRRSINRLARHVLTVDRGIHSSCYRNDYSMDIQDSPEFSHLAPPVGVGHGKSPEEALVRSLWTARRAQLTHIHPEDLTESRVGRMMPSLRIESRFGHIATNSAITICRLETGWVLASSDIGGFDGEEPLRASGPGIISATQHLSEMFNFNSRYYAGMNAYRIEQLPLTAFDEID